MGIPLTGALIVKAVISFISTTVDDFAVILLFFAKAYNSPNVTLGMFRTVLGMGLGMTLVIAISLVGMLLGAFIPGMYVDLIGFFPLLIGVYQLYEVLREDGNLKVCGLNPEEDEGIEKGVDGEEKSGDEKDVESGAKVPTGKRRPLFTSRLQRVLGMIK